MKTHLIRTAAIALAATLSCAPAIAGAVTGSSTKTVHADYEAAFTPANGLAIPWTGTLLLTFTPDGIIQGFYRPGDTGPLVPVTGGRTGDNVWIDIGSSGRLHIDGKLHDGSITGGAFDERTQSEYTFSAKAAG